MKPVLYGLFASLLFFGSRAFTMIPCPTMMGYFNPVAYQYLLESRGFDRIGDRIRELERSAVGRKVRLTIEERVGRNGRGQSEFVEGTVLGVGVVGTNRNTVTYHLRFSSGDEDKISLDGMETLERLNAKRIFLD
jgi:hypothetical protein